MVLVILETLLTNVNILVAVFGETNQQNRVFVLQTDFAFE
jgi:hypothetical protein